MNKLKENKAITLIALIITIIVLLILAGVVINMTVGNNGIIKKSQVATEVYKTAALKEEANLAIAELKVAFVQDKTKTEATIAEYVQTQNRKTEKGTIYYEDGEYYYTSDNGGIVNLINENGELKVGENINLENGSNAKYTLTYNANGGKNGPANVTVDAGTTVKISNVVPTISGANKGFIGWSDSKDSTEVVYQAGDEIELKSNKTIYAVWTTYTQNIGTETPFAYTGNYQTYEVKDTGYYKIECWGAQGGMGENSKPGAKGGYTRRNNKIK